MQRGLCPFFPASAGIVIGCRRFLRRRGGKILFFRDLTVEGVRNLRAGVRYDIGLVTAVALRGLGAVFVQVAFPSGR